MIRVAASSGPGRGAAAMWRLGSRLRGVALAGLAAAGLLAAAPSPEPSVGFAQALAPAQGGAPAIPLAIWWPSTAPATEQPLGLFRQMVAAGGAVAGSRLPLVLISHGSGGTSDGHYDTALALARAGFVVAALQHPGDNFRDQSRAAHLEDRPRDLVRALDWMLGAWPEHARLDPGRVGAFGFSAGGFTVLAAAGGKPDLSRFRPHCAAHASFYDCRLVARSPGAATPTGGARDGRLRALVVAAPAAGFTFAGGLGGVTQPVQLWRADEDGALPAPYYADAVRAALPRPPEFHGVPGADHWDFLAPCTPALATAAPAICGERYAFDRTAFHRAFNAEAVRFLTAALAQPARTTRSTPSP